MQLYVKSQLTILSEEIHVNLEFEFLLIQNKVNIIRTYRVRDKMNITLPFYQTRMRGGAVARNRLQSTDDCNKIALDSGIERFRRRRRHVKTPKATTKKHSVRPAGELPSESDSTLRTRTYRYHSVNGQCEYYNRSSDNNNHYRSVGQRLKCALRFPTTTCAIWCEVVRVLTPDRDGVRVISLTDDVAAARGTGT
ncbi:hypothetical protein AGLY_001057 [Aphis glycines]|uniref:Uncharacterized protein n=1 Tax=Aphis glycines TaxID=307491 RepID=A0A6G0U8W6_APHGL|nr:hypothetical protein AGLY_001057 [Aphis glycines]